MKKLLLTTAILLGMSFGAFAEWTPSSGWLFFDLFNSEENEEETNIGLFENDEANAAMWENMIEIPSFSANNGGGGLFGRGKSMSDGVGSGFRNGNGLSLLLPTSHGDDGDAGADAPLGSGVVVLLGLGAAYLVGKKRREE